MNEYRVPPRKKVTIRVESEGLPDLIFDGLLDHITVMDGEDRAEVYIDAPKIVNDDCGVNRGPR